MGEYNRAHLVKEAADKMAVAEMQSTMAAFEAETRLKENKILQNHRQDAEALMQKGTRGRSELELQRVEETDRRAQRYRNVMAVRSTQANLRIPRFSCKKNQTATVFLPEKEYVCNINSMDCISIF